MAFAVGCRALLAAIGVLLAQSPYRPLILGITPVQPTGAWGGSQPFPAGGRAGYSIGACGVKEYYNRTGTFGWFVFFQAISWSLRTREMVADLLRFSVADSGEFPTLRLPFSNIGGAGLVYRKPISSKWHFTLSADMRIAYISYRQWSITTPAGIQYDLLVESNSFIGFALSPTIWMRLEEDNDTFLGMGLAYPVLWGRGSYYTITKQTPDGQRFIERNPYYLVPRYVEIRAIVSFRP